jgi:oxygen-independent coproporphyrinogen-3 oxidase
MHAAVRERLAALGYPIYEISNYAPAGHEARHNLTYWRGESYLGLGAGAHSFARNGAGGRRWWNERGPAPYVNRATAEGTAEAGSEVVDGGVAAGEFVFLNLRLRSGFALGDFERRFGQSFDEIFGARAAALFESTLLIRDGDRIRLSDRGLELADSIFAEFV